MAKMGTAFFDNKGQFHKTPEEATVADLAAILGKIGDGESLAPGIAYMLLEKREEIEALFKEFDSMKADIGEEGFSADNVTKMPTHKSS